MTPAPVYRQIVCTQPAICYVINCIYFLIAKRDPHLFSYWLGGQLWGKAGRPAACCSPMPSCNESDNQGHREPLTGSLSLGASHWEPLTGSRTTSRRKRKLRSSHFLKCRLQDSTLIDLLRLYHVAIEDAGGGLGGQSCSLSGWKKRKERSARRRWNVSTNVLCSRCDGEGNKVKQL